MRRSRRDLPIAPLRGRIGGPRRLAAPKEIAWNARKRGTCAASVTRIVTQRLFLEIRANAALRDTDAFPSARSAFRRPLGAALANRENSYAAACGIPYSRKPRPCASGTLTVTQGAVRTLGILDSSTVAASIEIYNRGGFLSESI